jgi:heme A synthase
MRSASPISATPSSSGPRPARRPRIGPILYVALLVFGLRGAIGTYQVLYRLDGTAAVLQLIDMVLSVAAFVGMLNFLPGVLGVERQRRP